MKIDDYATVLVGGKLFVFIVVSEFANRKVVDEVKMTRSIVPEYD